MHRRPARVPVLASILVFALTAIACGGVDDTEPSAATATTPASTTAPTGTVAAPTAPAGTATAPTDTGPLTASFRGVTPEVIKVGVATFDWDALAAVGVRFGVSNGGDLYRAALEAINDRGGIHGRTLELHSVEFLPVGAEAADKACLELTEDHGVFVVVGTTLNDQILCFTQLHDTAALVAAGMTEERLTKSTAPYATVSDMTENRAAAFLDLMESTGVLDDATVGVTGSVDVSETGFQTMVDTFRAAGYDLVEGLIGGNADDLAASAREQALIYQRMDEAGVNVTVDTTGVPLAMANFYEAGYEADQWLLSTVMTGRGLTDAGVPLSYLDGALSVVNSPIGTSLQPDLADDPLASACVDDLVARTGHALSYALETEINDLGAALIACSIATILEAALTNAGRDLTNDSFRAGLEAVGEIALPGYTDASLGPGDLGAVKGLTLVRFDAETGIWEPLEQ